MIGKLTRYGLPYSNVVPNGTATNQITPGRTLENISLKLSGTALTKAMLAQVKVKANGRTIIDATGSQIDKVNAYRGQVTDAGYLDIQFSDIAMNNEVDRVVGAFDTSRGVSNLTTEITIAGATAPVLTPILIESAQQKLEDGTVPGYAFLIAKLLNYPWSQATGGRLPVNLPFGPNNGSIIKRIHVFHTGNMTGATLKVDGVPVHESLRLENEYQQKKHGRTPQANVYTLDFVIDGDIRKALNTRATNKPLELLCDFSAADNGIVLVEYLDPLGNL